MAGWNLIQQMIDEGKRPLVRNDLWDEIRAATAERVNAYNLLVGDGTARYRDAVNVRDPIGRTDAYQVSIASRVMMPAPWTTLCYWYAKWLKEEEGDAHPLYYFDGARGGDEYEHNVFPEALGAGKTHWTHSLKDLNRMLPHADIWTDMAKVLNLLIIPRVIVPMDAHTYKAYHNNYESGDDWPGVVRPAIWTGLNHTPPGWTVPDFVGRIGAGYNGAPPYSGWGYYRAYCEKSIDFTDLWNVEHLDASACDPTRVIFFLQYKRNTYWSQDVFEDVPVKIELSGDGGTTRELLRTLDAINDGGNHWLKLVSADSTRWTANSLLRITYTGDPTADTPPWTVGDDYSEAVSFFYYPFFIFAEFDWEFKP